MKRSITTLLIGLALLTATSAVQAHSRHHAGVRGAVSISIPIGYGGYIGYQTAPYYYPAAYYYPAPHVRYGYARGYGASYWHGHKHHRKHDRGYHSQQRGHHGDYYNHDRDRGRGRGHH